MPLVGYVNNGMSRLFQVFSLVYNYSTDMTYTIGCNKYEIHVLVHAAHIDMYTCMHV